MNSPGQAFFAGITANVFSPIAGINDAVTAFLLTQVIHEDVHIPLAACCRQLFVQVLAETSTSIAD